MNPTITAILALLETLKGTPAYQEVIKTILLPEEAKIESSVTNPIEKAALTFAFDAVNKFVGYAPPAGS